MTHMINSLLSRCSVQFELAAQVVSALFCLDEVVFAGVAIISLVGPSSLRRRYATLVQPYPIDVAVAVAVVVLVLS